MTAEKLLELEYNYIKEMLQQTNADRYQMLNFYIGISAAIGSVGLGIISFNSAITPELKVALGLLAVSSWFIGLIFMGIMIRLRQAWYEAVKAINKLKEFAIDNYKLANLHHAISWRSNNVPRLNKLWNIHFYATLLIIILGSAFLGLGVYLLSDSLLWTGIAFGVNLITQLVIYRVSLARNL